MDTSKAKILSIIAENLTVKKDIQLTVKERLGLSYSTIQRLMKQYLADGSLHLKARHYSVTREGEEWLSKRQKTPEMPFKDLKLKRIVDKLPTPQHRKFVYFILSAITAKRYLWDKEDTFWPSFIIGGLTGDIKTLLAEIVCRALRLPRADHIQDAIRKSVAQVLGSFDKIVNGKRTLDPAPYYSYLLICWDDIDKIRDRAVWKAMMSYIDGWAYREERGTYVERRHTCLITMNFKEAKLQIEEPYLRRCFVVDSKGLHLDPKQNEIIGSEIGDALKNLPKLKIDNLPVSFRKLGKADKDFMRDLLFDRWLKSKDDGRVIDTSFLEKIVLGWLILNQTGDVKDAIYWAVEGALLFLQTQDRVKEGWRGELTTEWGNYQAGVNPNFKEEWQKHLEQVKKDNKVVRDYKGDIEKKQKTEDDERRDLVREYAKVSAAFKSLKSKMKAAFKLAPGIDILYAQVKDDNERFGGGKKRQDGLDRYQHALNEDEAAADPYLARAKQKGIDIELGKKSKEEAKIAKGDEKANLLWELREWRHKINKTGEPYTPAIGKLRANSRVLSTDISKILKRPKSSSVAWLREALRQTEIQSNLLLAQYEEDSKDLATEMIVGVIKGVHDGVIWVGDQVVGLFKGNGGGKPKPPTTPEEPPFNGRPFDHDL